MRTEAIINIVQPFRSTKIETKMRISRDSMYAYKKFFRSRLLSGSNEDHEVFWDCGTHLVLAAVLID